MRFLDGRHPRLTHVLPMVRSSVIAAVFPSSCAVSAAANAVEPEPRITRSKWSTIYVLLLVCGVPLPSPSAQTLSCIGGMRRTVIFGPWWAHTEEIYTLY